MHAVLDVRRLWKPYLDMQYAVDVIGIQWGRIHMQMTRVGPLSKADYPTSSNREVQPRTWCSRTRHNRTIAWIADENADKDGNSCWKAGRCS